MRRALANRHALLPELPAFDRSRYPEAYLRQGYPEAVVQRMVLTRLAQLGVEAYVVESGAARLRGRVAGMLRSQGLRAGPLLGMATGTERGICDVHGVARATGRAVHIEVKAPAWLVLSPKTGKLIQRRAAGEATPDQVVFIGRMRRAGSFAGFAWGPGDVDAILASGPSTGTDT